MRRYLFLSLLALLVVVGCGGGEALRIGAVLPLTGDFELYGQSVRKGVELALDHLRERGDFSWQVESVILDSEGDPELAKELLDKEYDAGAIAVIGGVTTPEALAMVDVADRAGRILISPSASSPELTGISRNFYRVFPNDQREGTTMGNFAARKLQLENVVIVGQEAPYARGIQEVFKTEFERNGGEVTEVISYPEGAGDFSGFVDRVITLGPQSAYLAAYAQDVGRMLTDLRRKGFDGTLMTTSAFAAPEIIEQVGDPAEGVFLTQAVFEVDSPEPQIQEFVNAYRDKYGLAPDLYAAHGYDAVMVVAAAVEELEDGPVANDMWKGIRQVKDFNGVTGTIQFDERGDVQKFPRVYVIEGGNLVDYEREVTRRREELLERLRRIEEAQRRQSGDG